jgi:hypothetical protein
MTAPARPTDLDAIDQAWVDFHYGRRSRIDAAREMALAGLLFAEAQLLLDGHTLPSRVEGLAAVSR